MNTIKAEYSLGVAVSFVQSVFVGTDGLPVDVVDVGVLLPYDVDIISCSKLFFKMTF